MKKIFLLFIFLFFNFNYNVFSLEETGFCFQNALYGGSCYNSKTKIINTENSIVFKKEHLYSIKKNAIFLNLSVSNLGFGYTSQYSIGKNTSDIIGPNAKIIEGEKGEIYQNLEQGDNKYKMKSISFEFQFGIDYSYYLSRYFSPLIGFYFGFSPSFNSTAYQHIFSTTDELGLKNSYLDFNLLLQFGLKLGNVIQINENHLIIPYLTAGYSYRKAYTKASYKVEPYEEEVCSNTGRHRSCHYVEKDHKEEQIDSGFEHFVFFGGGVDYHYSAFRIGIYAKVHFPVNNLILKDIDGSVVNFGNRLIVSVGGTLGLSVPFVF